jgi:hypothetical protein
MTHAVTDAEEPPAVTVPEPLPASQFSAGVSTGMTPSA